MATTESPIQVVQHPFVFRLLQVKRATWLTPHMVRITLTGDQLPGFRSEAADDGIRLYFPPDPTDASWVPTVEGSAVVWPDETAKLPSREYSGRRYDADANELDIDFVVHGEGPASTWAANAEPGHYLGVSGPRRSRVMAGNVDWYLLVGDEAGLPAIARRIEELPSGTPVVAVLEVANSSEEQPIQTLANLMLVWVHRDEAEPGRNDLLEEAIRSLDFPPGDVFAWAAGEAGEMREVRRHLLNERGIPAERMRVTGYWKRAISNWDHHLPLED
jgi:NADPH-dependent ferric siderophore reductase